MRLAARSFGLGAAPRSNPLLKEDLALAAVLLLAAGAFPAWSLVASPKGYLTLSG